MAKKRKIKKKPQSPLVLEAQRKKEFMRRLVRLAKTVGAEEALRWIPKQDLDMLFHTRFRAVRIAPADDNIPSRLLKSVKNQLDTFLNESVITLREDRPGITVKDYLVVGISLYYYIKGSEELASTCAPIVREKFALLIEAMEGEEHSPMDIIETSAGVIGAEITRVNRRLYWFDHEIEFKANQLYNCLYMHSLPPEKQKITINDISRLVYRVGWAFPNHGMLWAEVKGADFGFDNALSQQPVRVYIQSHALVRLKERLDFIDTPSLHLYLYKSMENLKVAKTESGQLLIEYYFNKKKLGYLAFDLLGKKLVIKTFLFLTMDGTPEGEALRQMLGIEAVDKKYLEIDRLSTFILTDIKDNPEILDKFTQAGCAELFMLDNEEINAIPRIEKARMIQSYLNVPSKAEEIPNVEL